MDTDESKMVASSPEDGGFLVLYGDGNLVSIVVNEIDLVSFVKKEKEDIATLLTKRFGLVARAEAGCMPLLYQPCDVQETKQGEDPIALGSLTSSRGFYRMGFEDPASGEALQCWCPANFDAAAIRQNNRYGLPQRCFVCREPGLFAWHWAPERVDDEAVTYRAPVKVEFKTICEGLEVPEGGDCQICACVVETQERARC